ncbi:MAG: MFS transporter [Tannerella sp.]|jgi:FHS family L-fucose permease-like MFS transporter|nr:MFS transporter [Tannerella sp.]
METKKNYALPIFMMILLFGMISFVTNLAAPMGVVLKNLPGVTEGMGLLGNMANFIAYAVMGIPGGILLQRIGYKKTALLAIAIGFVGIFIQYLSGHAGQSSAFIVYLLGAFVAGFSMTLLNTVVNPMLNTLGGGGNKGNQLIQIGGSFNSVMATFTPAFVGVLIGEAAKAQITDIFPVMYMALGVFALIFVVLWLVKIPEPQSQWSSEKIGTLMSGAIKFRHFILGAVGIFVYVGVEVGTPGILLFWLSDTIAVNGAAIAGSVAGTYWFLMLIGRLCGASVGGKVSSKTMLTVGSLVAAVLVLAAIFAPVTSQVSMPVWFGGFSFGFAQVPINAMFLVLVGLCTSIMWGGIFNLAVEGLGKYIAVASGLFMVMVCGGGILPWIQEMVAKSIGYQLSYWVMFAGFAYLLFYAVIGSKNVNKDIKVD